MRRIDVVLIGVGIFATGGIAYLVLRGVGFDAISSGLWAQLLLMLGLIGWLATYGFRALTQTMTYNRQLKDYEDAVLQKRLEEMTPEELEKLQAELDAEKAVKGRVE